MGVNNTVQSKLKNVMEDDKKYEGVDDELLQELEDEYESSKVVKSSVKPLPTYGAGPVFGAVTIILTILGIVFGHVGPLKNGVSSTFRIPYIVFGAALICIALMIWTRAIFDVRIDDYINSGRLATKGVYSLTRNPIYAAILFICTGALFISGNVYMYVLPILFWVFLTVLLQKTEEVWLLARFGDEYRDYMRKVNRVIPLKKMV